MSTSLSWMPITNQSAGWPPQYLEAPGNDGETYRVSALNDPNGVITGWLLTHDAVGETRELGHFDDAVDAQLHAQQHHDQQ
jgi:hypothetical protein